jgi:hypothetical protein
MPLGEVWTGEGTARRRRTAVAETPNENALGAALRVRYGQFDYFMGGDLPGSAEKPEMPADDGHLDTNPQPPQTPQASR